MKARVITAAAGTLLLLGVWLIATPWSHEPPSSLRFTVLPINATNSLTRSYAVAVSNASELYILHAFWGHPGNPWLDVAFLNNGIWRSVSRPGIGGGSTVLCPHGVEKGTIEVPAVAEAFKVGLDVTSLTWRGRIAWTIGQSRCQRVLRPMVTFLMPLDTNKHAKLEWSREYLLEAVRN